MVAIDPSTQLWQAWSLGRLCLQGCASCGALRHPPSQVCGQCHSTETDLVDINGNCTLVSWSTVYRAPAPIFAGDLPYSVAIVAIEGGALVQARVSPDVHTAGFVVGLPLQIRLGKVVDRWVPTVSPM